MDFPIEIYPIGKFPIDIPIDSPIFTQKSVPIRRPQPRAAPYAEQGVAGPPQGRAADPDHVAEGLDRRSPGPGTKPMGKPWENGSFNGKTIGKP